MKLDALPDLRTPLLWLLSAGLLAALLGIAAGHVKLAEARAELADVRAVQQRIEAQRAGAALKDAEAVIGGQAQHATDQQEIVHALTKPDPALAAALADNRALAVRLRDTSAKLAAASLGRDQGEGDAAACRSEGDQFRAVFGLLQEAGRLSVEAGDLALESRGIVGRRDAEVRALKRLIEADRALMEAGAGRLMEAP